MVAFLFSFLRNHFLAALAGTGGIVVLALIGVQHLEIAHMRNQVTQCRAQSVVLATSNDRLKSAIAAQNDAVDALRAASLARMNSMRAAIADARKKAQAYTRKAALLKRQKTTTDRCADMRALIDAYFNAAP